MTFRPIYYYINTIHKRRGCCHAKSCTAAGLIRNYEREQWIVILISTLRGCARLHWITSRWIGNRKVEDIMGVTGVGRLTHVFTSVTLQGRSSRVRFSQHFGRKMSVVHRGRKVSRPPLGSWTSLINWASLSLVLVRNLPFVVSCVL